MDKDYISHATPRLEFISFGKDKDWLDVNIGNLSLRIDITNEEISIVARGLWDLKIDAINSLLIKENGGIQCQ